MRYLGNGLADSVQVTLQGGHSDRSALEHRYALSGLRRRGLKPLGALTWSPCTLDSLEHLRRILQEGLNLIGAGNGSSCYRCCPWLLRPFGFLRLARWCRWSRLRQERHMRAGCPLMAHTSTSYGRCGTCHPGYNRRLPEEQESLGPGT